MIFIIPSVCYIYNNYIFVIFFLSNLHLNLHCYQKMETESLFETLRYESECKPDFLKLFKFTCPLMSKFVWRLNHYVKLRTL
jgi:hypothetical protein